jgi:anti-sigma B factor antagonist
MPLTVSSRLEDNFAILELAGTLKLGPSLSTLRETARRALNGNKVAGMILRVAEVTSVDSAGLGELTVVYTLASKRGCPIMLVEVNPTLRKVLEITHLDALLPSAADMESAKKRLKER